MKYGVFKLIYAFTLESAIWRCAQSHIEGTVQVGEPPYSYSQVVVMMLPASPGHFGLGAE